MNLNYSDLRNFKVPKKTLTDDSIEVGCSSDEGKRYICVIEQSFKVPATSKKKFTPESITLIKSSVARKKYDAKKNSLKKSNSHFTESFGFMYMANDKLLNKMIKQGQIKTGNVLDSQLAVGKMGVSLMKHADIFHANCNINRAGYILIVKYLKGPAKTVKCSKSPAKPNSKYNMYICKFNEESKNTFEAFHSSQIFLYEYDSSGNIEECPSVVLPICAVKFNWEGNLPYAKFGYNFQEPTLKKILKPTEPQTPNISKKSVSALNLSTIKLNGMDILISLTTEVKLDPDTIKLNAGDYDVLGIIDEKKLNYMFRTGESEFMIVKDRINILPYEWKRYKINQNRPESFKFETGQDVFNLKTVIYYSMYTPSTLKQLSEFLVKTKTAMQLTNILHPKLTFLALADGALSKSLGIPRHTEYGMHMLCFYPCHPEFYYSSALRYDKSKQQEQFTYLQTQITVRQQRSIRPIDPLELKRFSKQQNTIQKEFSDFNKHTELAAAQDQRHSPNRPYSPHEFVPLSEDSISVTKRRSNNDMEVVEDHCQAELELVCQVPAPASYKRVKQTSTPSTSSPSDSSVETTVNNTDRSNTVNTPTCNVTDNTKKRYGLMAEIKTNVANDVARAAKQQQASGIKRHRDEDPPADLKRQKIDSCHDRNVQRLPPSVYQPPQTPSLYDPAHSTYVPLTSGYGLHRQGVESMNPNYQPTRPDSQPRITNQQPIRSNYQPMIPNQQPIRLGSEAKRPNFQPSHQPIRLDYQPMIKNQQPIRPEYQPMIPNQQPIRLGCEAMRPNYQPIRPEYQPMITNQQPIRPEYQPIRQFNEPMRSNYQPIRPDYQPIIQGNEPMRQNYQSFRQANETIRQGYEPLRQNYQAIRHGYEPISQGYNPARYGIEARFAYQPEPRYTPYYPPSVQSETRPCNPIQSLASYKQVRTFEKFGDTDCTGMSLF